MRLRIFKADKGDCLLLTGAGKQNVLIDGGMRNSYTDHVSRTLGRLDRLERVYISHIDRDHVFGVLQMMDDKVDWTVHRFQTEENANPGHPRPRSKEPPEIGGIWQNAFRDQVGDNTGRIEDLLAAQAGMLSAHALSDYRELAIGLGELAQSVGDQLKLSRRLGPNQLNIPINPEFDGLMYHTTPADPIAIGGMRFTVIGPFQEELSELRQEWNAWLEKNTKELARIQRAALRDEERLANDELDSLRGLLQAEAGELSKDELIDQAALQLASAVKLGLRRNVTQPNLTSLMFHVEENGRTLLLTGDGHWQDIVDGLELAGLLQPNSGMHVNVLKVPHHGSEHNTSEAFCRRITADNYVFCGNGAHENPDLRVVNAIIDSRIGKAGQLSPNPQVDRRFKLWFNYHPTNEQGGRSGTKHREHLAKLEKLVKKRAKSPKLRFEFFKNSSRSFRV